MTPPWPVRGTSLAPDNPRREVGNHASDRSTQRNAEAAGTGRRSGSSDSESRPQRPRHGRSISQPLPFTSLFARRKKKKQTGTAADIEDSDSLDDVDRMLRQSQLKPTGVGTRDFATGSCMTCGSLVRWPKGLSVFKCTVCLTVNDLESPSHESPITPTRAAANPRWHKPASVKPISIDDTKSLIRQCIRSFLVEALSGHRAALGYFQTSSRPSAGDQTGSGSRPPGDSRLMRGEAHINDRKEHLEPQRRGNHASRSLSISFPSHRSALSQPLQYHDSPHQPGVLCGLDNAKILKPLEDYIIACFSSVHCLSRSFLSHGTSNAPPRLGADDGSKRRADDPISLPNYIPSLTGLDAKLLLVGDFAENGSWWTGGQEDPPPMKGRSHTSEDIQAYKASRTPNIEWAALETWYWAIISAAEHWEEIYEALISADNSLELPRPGLENVETQVLLAQEHCQRVLLKATETFLKRPGRPITDVNDLRCLVMLLENPLLHASSSRQPFSGRYVHISPKFGRGEIHVTRGTGPASGRHSGIIKRILGLISNSPPELHEQLIMWLSRFPRSHFLRIKDLVGGFLAYRLTRQGQKKPSSKTVDITSGLIPNMAPGHSAATLHATLGRAPGASKPPEERSGKTLYSDDWQIRAAARVMSLVFAANNISRSRKLLSDVDSKDRTHPRNQVLPTSDFYMALLDSSDLIADFEAWERKRGKFSFCQYPFLLSVWAKIQILEYDTRRQMQRKARDAFFDSILTHRNIDQYLKLSVRRDCLVEDSLAAVSAVLGGGNEDIKKGLRITFRGEEGIDAGGLRKEWFLLLVRELFDADHGMFIYDDESRYCYFNPFTFETSDQFFLVGVVLGLAIYNSTILDVALPPFAFRKLLGSAPSLPASLPAHVRPPASYSLDDLAEFRPRLAQGLRQLLDFDGDVEPTFCLDFTVDAGRYGSHEQVPLCPGGEKRPVTNANRREYVDLYIRYLLDTAVARQFEPFKRGFFTVCGGNALSLFRPEEIELLVRGSEEALDIASLKLAADYDGWGCANPSETEPTVQWFWGAFEEASRADQRKLLAFITGSDRLPATGAASLTIRLLCLGDEGGPNYGRYPTARTCFNTLSLLRYPSKERLVNRLWGAVHESAGFGLK